MKTLHLLTLSLLILLGTYFQGVAQNVGVGTANPQFGRLMIEASAVPLSFRETGVLPENGGLWRMPLDGGVLRFDVNTGAAGSEFTTATTRQGVLSMAPSGNVGIGTIYPDNKLHVYIGNSAITPFSLASIVTESSVNNYINILAPNAYETGVLFGNNSAAVSGGVLYNNPNLLNGLQFRTGGNATRMVIDQDGLVGINKMAPEFDLDVNGTIQSQYLQPGFKSGSYEFFRLGNPGDYWGGIMHNLVSPNYGDGDDLTLFTYGDRDITLRPGNGDVHLLPNGSGRAGIGTTAPTAKLDVNGGIRWGTAGALLSTNQGAAIELRGTGTPFLDFSNDGSIDYDARIILSGNDRLVVQGSQFVVLNTISATRVKVTATGYPDYVFYDDYQLKSLKEVQAFIKENGHLPGVPSEKEIVENGLDLNDQSMWQQEKIEELFLHMIEMDEKMESVIKENTDLKQQVEHLNAIIKKQD